MSHAWKIQKNVVFALYIRELKARFSHFRLGYIWAIAEPLAMVALLSIIRMALGKKDIAGISYPLFFATGIIPYYFFQTSVTQLLSVIESNMPLMNYRIVKPIDPVIAKIILEFLIYMGTGVLIVGGLVFLGFGFTWNNTLGLILVMACLISFTLGIGLITSVIGAFLHESKKIVPIIIRPFFFISGIFFPATMIPSIYRDKLLWNPLLHVSELTRRCIFEEFTVSHGNIMYLFFCSITSLGLGLCVYRVSRLKLSTSGNIR